MDMLLIINSAWNVESKATTWNVESKATTVVTDTPALILNVLVAVPAIIEKKVLGK